MIFLCCKSEGEGERGESCLYCVAQGLCLTVTLGISPALLLLLQTLADGLDNFRVNPQLDPEKMASQRLCAHEII